MQYKRRATCLTKIAEDLPGKDYVGMQRNMEEIETSDVPKMTLIVVEIHLFLFNTKVPVLLPELLLVAHSYLPSFFSRKYSVSLV